VACRRRRCSRAAAVGDRPRRADGVFALTLARRFMAAAMSRAAPRGLYTCCSSGRTKNALPGPGSSRCSTSWCTVRGGTGKTSIDVVSIVVLRIHTHLTRPPPPLPPSHEEGTHHAPEGCRFGELLRKVALAGRREPRRVPVDRATRRCGEDGATRCGVGAPASVEVCAAAAAASGGVRFAPLDFVGGAVAARSFGGAWRSGTSVDDGTISNDDSEDTSKPTVRESPAVDWIVTTQRQANAGLVVYTCTARRASVAYHH